MLLLFDHLLPCLLRKLHDSGLHTTEAPTGLQGAPHPAFNSIERRRALFMKKHQNALCSEPRWCQVEDRAQKNRGLCRAILELLTQLCS